MDPRHFLCDQRRCIKKQMLSFHRVNSRNHTDESNIVADSEFSANAGTITVDVLRQISGVGDDPYSILFLRRQNAGVARRAFYRMGYANNRGGVTEVLFFAFIERPGNHVSQMRDEGDAAYAAGGSNQRYGPLEVGMYQARPLPTDNPRELQDTQKPPATVLRPVRYWDHFVRVVGLVKRSAVGALLRNDEHGPPGRTHDVDDF